MERDPVGEAVRSLRLSLEESQQEFAHRLKVAIRTIARYEGGQPPRGKALGNLACLAFEFGFKDHAAIFRAALEREMGLDGPIPKLEKRTGIAFREWNLEEQKWFKALESVMDGVVRDGGSINGPRGLLSKVD